MCCKIGVAWVVIPAGFGIWSWKGCCDSRYLPPGLLNCSDDCDTSSCIIFACLTLVIDVLVTAVTWMNYLLGLLPSCVLADGTA